MEYIICNLTLKIAKNSKICKNIIRLRNSSAVSSVLPAAISRFQVED